MSEKKTNPLKYATNAPKTKTSLVASILDMEKAGVHPDLKKEREICTFSPDKLSSLLFGKKLLTVFGRVRRIVAHNPAFDTRDLWWMSGFARYIRACHQAEEFVRMVRYYRLMDDPAYMDALLVMTGEDFFIHVHMAMFVPSIENFADDEQKAEWLQKAKNFTILGTYSQTELGHGSNLAGLETIAEFDPETDEWILRTPTMTSTKWWAGGLAKSCTHCILMARVTIRNVDFGVHPFILQVRDMNSHATLNGIVLRHLGQKLGYNGMDNGTMQLHGARIPRRNLLMKFCTVDREGNFKRKSDQKLLYATMTFTRKQIIMNAGLQLAKCCTIATRYSAVRRQFPSPSAEMPKDMTEMAKIPEAPVLDYYTQQHTLIPLVATSIAYFLSSQQTNAAYDAIMEECRQGDFTRLSDIHAMTSALKATMTNVVVDSIEACRKACGGHGYALASGIPLHLTNYIPQATYEGDFVVLSIQAGRILMKSVENKMLEKPIQRLNELSTNYIYTFDLFFEHQIDTSSMMDFTWQITAFKKRSCVLTYKAANEFSEYLQNGATMLQALDDVKLELTRVTVAYANVMILEAFQTALDRASESTKELEVLTTLRSLFALTVLSKDFGEFCACKVVLPERFDELKKIIKSLIKKLRPNIVGITDSFGFPDYLLNSAIGRYDGRVYESLFKSTYDEPLNEHDVTDGYYRHLQYIIHPERKPIMNSKI